jgi:peptidoglycan/LPS O-acetylase OafA/YrhL
MVRPLWEAVADRLHFGHLLEDSQGALALLPAFQAGLWVALWTAHGRGRSARRAALGLTITVLAGLAVRAGWGELLRHGGIAAPILLVRAGAIAVPAALLGLLARQRAPAVAATAPSTGTRAVATATWS